MANVSWLARASATKEIKTVTIGGTWVAGDTISLDISGAILTLTVGAIDLPTILDDLVVMVSGNGSLSSGASANTLGNSVLEWTVITATEDGATVLTLTGPSGEPWTLTVTRVTADSGTAVGATSQSATGPKFADNVTNYSTGALPGNGDTLYFGFASAGPRYGLTALAAVTTLTLDIDLEKFTHSIGLPLTNPLGYREYRQRSLQIDGATLVRFRGTPRGNGIFRLDVQASQATVEVESLPSSSETGAPALNLIGTHADNSIEVNAGEAGLAMFESEAATFKTIDINGGRLQCGPGCTLDGAGSVATVGRRGTLETRTALLTVNVEPGGRGRIDESATVATLTIESGGEWNHRSSGTITALNLHGRITKEDDLTTSTITTLNAFPGGLINGSRNFAVTTLVKDADVDTIQFI